MRMTSKQLELPLKNSHGGRRKGAGRPNRSGLQAHIRRPRLKRGEPVHVTLKLRGDLPSLRRKESFRCLKAAVRKARAQGLRIIHFAILSNHIHLILESSGSELRRPLQSLGISLSKRINATMGRRGSVLVERYYAHVLKTPSEARNALAYVLTNESRHERRSQRPKAWRTHCFTIRFDPFSSALAFSPKDWKPLLGTAPLLQSTNWNGSTVDAWHSEVLSPPLSWLLKSGWKRGAPRH